MITLTFNNGLPNDSLKVGDLVYFIKNPSHNYETSGFITGDDDGVSTHILIGDVVSIQPFAVADPTSVEQTDEPYNFKLYIKPSSSYVGQVSLGNGLSSSGDYIFFMKNNLVEQSSIIGYYNSIKLMNNSKKRAELFAVSCNVTESSK
tara:strand:+ start:10661 stop:11104 length:444 start_codon:yes stop_codon:yes gene_type:complete